DVVADPTKDVIVTGAGVETVIALIAPQRVVAITRDDDVIAARTAEYDVVLTRVAEVVAVGTRRVWVVADDNWGDCDAVDGNAARGVFQGCRIGPAIGAQPRVLLARVDLQEPGRRREDVGGQMRNVSVGHYQLRERGLLELRAKLQACRARQVVEA